jgi:hypothetical protein
MPPRHWVRCAQVTGHSIDELVGLTGERASRPRGAELPWPFEWRIERYSSLPDEQKRDFRNAVRLALEGCELEASRPNRRHSKLARR